MESFCLKQGQDLKTSAGHFYLIPLGAPSAIKSRRVLKI